MDANPRLCAHLVDGHGHTIVVARAWPVVALRPPRLRWCRKCGSPECARHDHVSLSFTASQVEPDGHWTYRTQDAWPSTAPQQGRAVMIVNAQGDVVARTVGQPPWPDTWDYEGIACPLWCLDARGVVLYRRED